MPKGSSRNHKLSFNVLSYEVELACRLKMPAFALYVRYPLQHIDKNALAVRFGWSLAFAVVKPTWKLVKLKRHDDSRLPISCIIQDQLQALGLAVHNIFRGECTSTFGCCGWKDPELAGFLGALVQQANGTPENVDTSTSGVFISGLNIQECKICGCDEDTRGGVCFDCSDHVRTRQVIEGVYEAYDMRNPSNSWILQ